MRSGYRNVSEGYDALQARQRDEDLPVYIAPLKELFCVACGIKFDPKKDKRHGRHRVVDHHPKGQRHGAVSSDDPNITEQHEKRYATGMEGVDRILGGGFVDSMAIILGGTTGAGKSTLLGEISKCMCRIGARVLYCAAEETEAQVKGKWKKAGLTHKELHIVSSQSLEDVEREIARLRPHIVIFDSISRMNSMRALGAKTGSVAAMKAITERIIYLSKKSKHKIISIAIAHETKDGSIAGPQEVQHDYDVIWHFHLLGALRKLECEKNRFGPAPESTTFEFHGNRLREVKDVAVQILPTVSGGLGCVLFPSVSGKDTAVIPVESFVSAPRGEKDPPARPASAQGVTEDRLRDVLDALLEHTEISTKDRSVRVKARRANETSNLMDAAIDAALVVTLVSSAEKRSLPSHVAVFGELSPSGRVESDPHSEARIHAAKKAGVRRIVGPVGMPAVEGIEYHAVTDINALVDWVLTNGEHVERRARLREEVKDETSSESTSILPDEKK